MADVSQEASKAAQPSAGASADDATEQHPEPTYQQLRARVDRRMLEYILQDPKYTSPRGNHVFQLLAQRHGLDAVRPDNNFKIGARSRKDPTIRITAGLEVPRKNLEAAKTDVEHLLDFTRNRVIVRVEEAQEQHYYVIGKKGENTKRIMSATGCHIHFPDMHRGSGSQSQITLSGMPDGVDAARRSIRSLMPITVGFFVPPLVPTQRLQMTDDIRAIGEQHHVTLFFKQLADGTAACAKAARCRASNIARALRALAQHLGCPPLHAASEFVAAVDIPQRLRGQWQHGRGGFSFASLASSAPDVKVYFFNVSQGCALACQGRLERVCYAIELVLSAFPVSLSFYLPDQGDLSAAENLCSEAVKGLAATAGVRFMSSRDAQTLVPQGQVPNAIEATLSGTAGNVTALFTARSRLLVQSKKMGSTGHQADGTAGITPPSVDEVERDEEEFLSALAQSFGQEVIDATPQVVDAVLPCEDELLDVIYNETEAESSARGQPTSSLHSDSTLDSASFPPSPRASSTSPESSAGRTPEPSTLTKDGDEALTPRRKNDDSNGSSPGSDDRQRRFADYDQKRVKAKHALSNPDYTAPRYPSDYFAGDFFSKSVPASEWEEALKQKQKEARHSGRNPEDDKAAASTRHPMTALPSPNTSLSASSLAQKLQALREQAGRSSQTAAVPPPGLPKPTSEEVERHQQELLNASLTSAGLEGILAEGENIGGDDADGSEQLDEAEPAGLASEDASHRNMPTTTDSSSQESLYSVGSPAGSLMSGAWGSSSGVRSRDSSSAVPSSGSPLAFQSSSATDQQVLDYWDVQSLAELLNKLNLSKYNNLMEQQEIDLPTFLTLSDDDLKELGVATFGARRRMLMAIRSLVEMHQTSRGFLGSVYALGRTRASDSVSSTSSFLSPSSSLGHSSFSQSPSVSFSSNLSQPTAQNGHRGERHASAP